MYIYQNSAGIDQFRVVRRNGKKFVQESPDGNGGWRTGLNGAKPTLYRLPEVRRAVSEGREVYVVEGEKDVETARKLGVVATCNPGGAGKWRDEFSDLLDGARVTIIWDRDLAGRRHALRVGESLSGRARVRWRRARSGKDLSDHVEAGFGLHELAKSKPVVENEKSKNSADSGSFSTQFLPAAFQLVLNRLAGVTVESGKDHQYNARCPAHSDRRASLSVKLGGPNDAVVMFHCHAGCEPSAVAHALGVNFADLSYRTAEVEAAPDEPVEVQKALRTKRANRRADEILRQELTEGIKASHDEETSWDVLKQNPVPPLRYAIEDIAPVDANILLKADQKTGKTRFALNLCKAFCDEQPFLNYFPIHVPDGRTLMYLNYEMNESSFVRWVHEARIRDGERLHIKHLKRRSLPFWEDETRAEFVAELVAKHVWMIIWDTQIAAAGDLLTTENDSMEWVRWQTAVDRLKGLADVSVCLFLHHMGKADKATGRGSSRIEDWPDALWSLSRQNDSTDREFKTAGRDVTFESGRLLYDIGKHVYSYEGESSGDAVRERRVKAYVRSLAVLWNLDGDGHHKPRKSDAVDGNTLKLDFGQADRRSVHKICMNRGYVREVEDRSMVGSGGGRAAVRVMLTKAGLTFADAIIAG